MWNLPTVFNQVYILIFLTTIQGSIHKNLKYFETIHADDFSHKIAKRGLKESSHPFNHIKEVNFKSHGRDFRLIMSPKNDILHHNFKAYSVDADGKETNVHVDHNDFYQGRVFGEVKSDVRLHMENGMMTGSIELTDETYHIEPMWRHIPDKDNRTMITYKQSDIKFSWHPENFPHLGSRPKMCGYVKEGTELEDNEDENEISRWANNHHRQKRQMDLYEYTPTKTRCPLLLVADYRFFQEMGGSNTKTTINYLISLIDRVHKIYNDTSWQDRQEVDGFKGMGFVIKKIVVHSDPTRIKSGEAHYNMIREKWDVRNLLEGHCEKTIQDVVERFWDIIEDININKVLLFLKDNIVGTVVLVTALMWIPAGCVISYLDKKRKREEIDRWEWQNSDELIHSSDNIKRVIHLRVQNRLRNIIPGPSRSIPE